MLRALALAGLATLLAGTVASAQSAGSGSCRQGDPCMRSGRSTATGLFNTSSVPLPGGGSIDLGPQTTFMTWDSGELEVPRGLVHLAVSPQRRGPVTLTVPGGTVTVRDGEVVITVAARSASQVQVIAGRAIVADTRQDDTLVVPAGMSAEAAGIQVLGPQRMAPEDAAYRWWETGPAWWLVALSVIGCVAAAGMPVALLVRRRRDRRRIRNLAAAGLLS